MLGKGFGHERETNFTLDEQKTMMSLWTIFRSPLMLGAELTKLDNETVALLTNKALYEMYREAHGAREAFRDEKVIIWEAASGTKKYKAVFNISDRVFEVPETMLNDMNETAGEIWSGRLLREGGNWQIPSHGVLLFESIIPRDIKKSSS